MAAIWKMPTKNSRKHKKNYLKYCLQSGVDWHECVLTIWMEWKMINCGWNTI